MARFEKLPLNAAVRSCPGEEGKGGGLAKTRHQERELKECWGKHPR